MDIQAYIAQKQKRQEVLKNRKKELEVLSGNLKTSKFALFFGSTYLITKRISLFILGISLLIFALFMLISPNTALEYPSIKDKVAVQDLNFKSPLNFNNLQQVQNDSISYYNSKDIQKWSENMNVYFENSMETAMNDQLILSTKLIGFLLLLLALSFLYISRLSKQLKNYYYKIDDTKKLTKSILIDYQKTIEEEDKELEMFHEISKEEEDNNQENTSENTSKDSNNQNTGETPLFFKA